MAHHVLEHWTSHIGKAWAYLAMMVIEIEWADGPGDWVGELDCESDQNERQEGVASERVLSHPFGASPPISEE